jgi:hypothetical protein
MTNTGDQRHIGKKAQPLLRMMEVLPVCYRHPVGAHRHHHRARRWRLSDMAGTLTFRTLAMVITMGHLRQYG